MQFKCKATGLIYNFEFEVDILSMQKHPDYEVVLNDKSVPDNESAQETTKPVKTSKKAKVTQDEISINREHTNSGN